MSLCKIKTGKLIKENCSKKTSEIFSIEINYFLSFFVYLLLLFAVLLRVRCVR